MDIQGKGSLLLLLVSSLVLCRNVASHPTCLEGGRCLVILQDLYDIATYMSNTMHFHASDLFRQFGKQYSRDSFFFMPAIKRCHTADILAPAGKEEARLMQPKDLLNLVKRYLVSWKEPLLYLALEAYRLPEFSHFLSMKDRIISLKYRELEELTHEIGNQLDFERTDKVDVAVWSDAQSLQSPVGQTRLFTVYNTLRCFVFDAQKIDFLLSFLQCQAINEGTC